MSDLVAIAFDDELKAEEVRLSLLKMQREYLVDLEDAVVVVRGQDDKVLEELKQFEGKVLQTSLTHEEEAKLQAVLDSAKAGR